jgi:2-amino-1-hydroxyethylphosphonate dioxygenase (glycine-forming)
MTPLEVSNRIFDLYARFGSNDYIGEPVSQIEHMSQAAQLAINEGLDDEVVLAAFFHDIGHLCVAKDSENDMHGLGIKNHEKLGADYLRELGFPERVASLVESHVEAKRYLCYARPEYLAKLSEASQKTLELQGGIMNATEAKHFEQNPLANLMIKMREWDDTAKETDTPIIDFSVLKEKMIRVLQHV